MSLSFLEVLTRFEVSPTTQWGRTRKALDLQVQLSPLQLGPIIKTAHFNHIQIEDLESDYVTI